MKIQYIKGHLLTAPQCIIAHGCNSHGVMGSGVARVIREKYSYAFEKYHAEYKKNGLVLGSVVFAAPMPESDEPIVANCITQQNFGSNGEVYVDYAAIRSCMKNLEEFCIMTFIDSIGLPMIGAGLGGGDWTKISSIIEDELKETIPVVYQL